MLDGIEILAEEKVKAESLHGADRVDRETIFTTLLPQEKFVDRRLNMIEDLDVESEDQDSEENSGISATLHVTSLINSSQVSGGSLARKYVGELIQRVEYEAETLNANFIM